MFFSGLYLNCNVQTAIPNFMSDVTVNNFVDKLNCLFITAPREGDGFYLLSCRFFNNSILLCAVFRKRIVVSPTQKWNCLQLFMSHLYPCEPGTHRILFLEEPATI